MKLNKRQQEAIVRNVIKKYGATVDLEKSPMVLIEILREFGKKFADENGGLPPGGVGPVGPVARAEEVKLEHILREILKVAGDLKEIKKRLT